VITLIVLSTINTASPYRTALSGSHNMSFPKSTWPVHTYHLLVVVIFFTGYSMFVML